MKCLKQYGNNWQKIKQLEFFQKGINFNYGRGSHDNPDILPLKAGVCIMALGAMAKYNCKVKIVTCGLNYYE